MAQVLTRWLPENVSSFGGELDALFAFVFYVTAFWFVLTEGLLLCFLLRYRRSAGARARYADGSGPRQLAWILLPAAIVLLLDLWIDLRGAAVWARIKGEVPSADLTVRLAARQFNWEVAHPGPDGVLGTADDLQLENELHVPAGRIVRVVLESRDVIHSLFLPHLRFKQDIVPGRRIEAWFEATKPGRYEMPCAELCGFGHSGMKGWLYVHAPQDYEKWVKEKSRSS